MGEEPRGWAKGGEYRYWEGKGRALLREDDRGIFTVTWEPDGGTTGGYHGVDRDDPWGDFERQRGLVGHPWRPWP